MSDTIWTPMLGWAAAAAMALGLAAVAPHERTLLGKLPALQAKRLDQTRIVLPHELPSGRTLAVVVFKGSQREEARSWIEGLQLRRDSAIAWLKMPVLDDPGDEQERQAIEKRMQERHPDRADQARLVPLFTDRDAFVRAAGLTGSNHASVLVLDREGHVLARAEGAYHPAKAQALRETVLAMND